jgi:peptidoglycan/xylan/chitin deacetylase (PgdA/CDA1 family)
VPDKVVVLTFDDSVRSHFTVARPLLKKYRFGATFFITEGFDFKTDKDNYMTWEQIAQLHRDGFEIGNHTRDHLGLSDDNVDKLSEQLEAINARCKEHGIPRTISFAYPGNKLSDLALPGLQKLGIRFARRGGAPEYPYENGRGFAFEPGLDHPLLIPSAGDARPDWEFDDFIRAVQQAKYGRIAVLQFHGVPDKAHPWVHTPREKFESYMRYLALNKYRVIALRDVAKYVDLTAAPLRPRDAMNDRIAALEKKTTLEDARPAKNDEDLRYWLMNAVGRHRFHAAEAGRAVGLTEFEVREALDRFAIEPAKQQPTRTEDGRPVVLPYPGGRHPRIGFIDGAIRPQRETKFSVFTPWDGGGYVVADIPEAIWHNTEQGRALLYLAHDDVPTIWTKRGLALEPLEWDRSKPHRLRLTRTLPNKIQFAADIRAVKDGVDMQLSITNGTDHVLTGLVVQNCIMLKAAADFNERLNDNRNKVIQRPYIAAHNGAKNRWVITAWEPCLRPWGNVNCPCMHSDPKFPDCQPGETQRIRGWLSFYEGEDLAAELERLDQVRAK